MKIQNILLLLISSYYSKLIGSPNEKKNTASYKHPYFEKMDLTESFLFITPQLSNTPIQTKADTIGNLNLNKSNRLKAKDKKLKIDSEKEISNMSLVESLILAYDDSSNNKSSKEIDISKSISNSSHFDSTSISSSFFGDEFRMSVFSSVSTDSIKESKYNILKLEKPSAYLECNNFKIGEIEKLITDNQEMIIKLKEGKLTQVKLALKDVKFNLSYLPPIISKIKFCDCKMDSTCETKRDLFYFDSVKLYSFYLQYEILCNNKEKCLLTKEDIKDFK